MLVSVLLIFTNIAERLWIGENSSVIIILSTALVLSGLFEAFRRLSQKHIELTRKHYELKKDIKNNFRQTEALFSIFSCIQPNFPLPDTRGWAASPDLLKKLLEIIYLEKPKFVLEASSGVSTLIIAYCLKQIGCGKVISLDHETKYAKITEDQISLHGLEDVATIVHAPLTEIEINGMKWLWYSTEHLKIGEPIDLLVIDGPPSPIQKLARYPALPLLFDHLRDESIIILDDGARKDEIEIVEIWKSEFDCISYDFLEFEKGAFLVKKYRKPKSL